MPNVCLEHSLMREAEHASVRGDMAPNALQERESALIRHRDPQLDFMRAVAIMGVLVIHSVGRYRHTDLDLVVAGWLGLFCRPCIAVFLFVSGYLFNEHPDARYLARRLKRVLVPYLVF